MRILIYVLLVLIVANGCKTSHSAKARSKEKEAPLLIYIQQSACMRKCPEYKAWFYSGNRMVYHGIKNMPLLGRYEFFVPDELTKSLIFEAIKLNIKTLPDSIVAPPDAGQTRFWVVMNGKMKKTSGWIGCEHQAFNDYGKFLAKEVRAMITDQEGKKLEP